MMSGCLGHSVRNHIWSGRHRSSRASKHEKTRTLAVHVVGCEMGRHDGRLHTDLPHLFTGVEDLAGVSLADWIALHL